MVIKFRCPHCLEKTKVIIIDAIEDMTDIQALCKCCDKSFMIRVEIFPLEG